MTFEERVCRLSDEIFAHHKGRVSKTEAFDWANDVVAMQMQEEREEGERREFFDKLEKKRSRFSGFCR